MINLISFNFVLLSSIQPSRRVAFHNYGLIFVCCVGGFTV
nr:MAG TPA: hypothetical protein [Caudoviricetes sp.]